MHAPFPLHHATQAGFEQSAPKNHCWQTQDPEMHVPLSPQLTEQPLPTGGGPALQSGNRNPGLHLQEYTNLSLV